MIQSDYMGKRVIVRVDSELLEKYRKFRPELKRLTYSATTEAMLLELLLIHRLPEKEMTP